MIPYGMHYIDEADINAVSNVLRDGFLTQGPVIEQFENAFAQFVGSKYAVAVSSCTAGLHLATLAAGLKKGDALITSPITFVSSANAGLYVGAEVIFSDINSSSINIDPVILEQTIHDHPNAKVVVPVHFAGLPCDMEPIKKVCDDSEVAIIEDAAHALGASYKNGKMVGSCCHSLMTVFSLHPVKSIAAGEGGVITTNDQDTYRKLLRLRSHGINKLNDSFENKDFAFTDSELNPWYYEMQELGYHYRITDIQCALALSQLAKLPLFIAKRRKLATSYYKLFRHAQMFKSAQNEDLTFTSSFHIFVLRFDFERMSHSRASLMNYLRTIGIGTQVHYIPVPMQPMYGSRRDISKTLPNAFAYYQQALTIPLFYTLEQETQQYVASSIIKSVQ